MGGDRLRFVIVTSQIRSVDICGESPWSRMRKIHASIFDVIFYSFDRQDFCIAELLFRECVREMGTRAFWFSANAEVSRSRATLVEDGRI